MEEQTWMGKSFPVLIGSVIIIFITLFLREKCILILGEGLTNFLFLGSVTISCVIILIAGLRDIIKGKM